MGRMRLLVIFLVLLLIACVQPKVTEIQTHWGDITPEYSELIVVAKLENPLPFLPLKDVESLLYVNGIEIAEGHAIKIDGDKATLSIKIDNERIRDLWVSHLKSNESSEILVKVYPVVNIFFTELRSSEKFREKLDTDIFERKLNNEKLLFGGGEIFEIRELKIKRGKVSNFITEVFLSGEALNKGMIELEIGRIEYRILINGVEVGRGVDELNIILKPEERKRFNATFLLDNTKIPEWWIKHVRNGEKSIIEFKLTLHIKADGFKAELDVEQATNFSTNIAGSLMKN